MKAVTRRMTLLAFVSLSLSCDPASEGPSAPSTTSAAQDADGTAYTKAVPVPPPPSGPTGPAGPGSPTTAWPPNPSQAGPGSPTTAWPPNPSQAGPGSPSQAGPVDQGRGGGSTGGGGGGGGGQPGGSPGTGAPTAPTPTPTATARPCPPTLTATVNTATLVTDFPPFGLVIKPEEQTYGSECVVDKIEVSVRLTTAQPAVASASFSNPAASLGVCGQTATTSGCTSDTLFIFPSPGAVPPGQTIGGASCGSLTFGEDDTAVFNPYSSPPPPYTGRFAFNNPASAASGVFRDWQLNSGWDLSVFGGPSDFTVQCVTMRFTTKIISSPTPTPTPIPTARPTAIP